MNEAVNAAAPHISARRNTWICAALLTLAALAAHANSFKVPFVFDDTQAIQGNPAIQHLWPISTWLFPDQNGALTNSGRPVLTLSFALNYALSGESVWSYHALNLLIHLGAGLALFGLVRQTLASTQLSSRFGSAAISLAFLTAVLWLLHPLQTESVTYTVQRAESLMGFFYLVTLYAFARGAASEKSGAWFALSIISCALGMGTKEVMASAPLMVWLYDRTFIAGTFREAWRQRRKVYLGLAATWLLLAGLVFSLGGNRGGTMGFGVQGSWWHYELGQSEAIARYLKLSLWPHPLIFEYGMTKPASEAALWLCTALVLMMLLATCIALRRRPALGFLGAWFFVILTPTSLVPSAVQMIVEHRVYLSLAAIMTLAVTGLFIGLGRLGLLCAAVIALAFGFFTFRRNQVYQSELALWTDTVAKRPGNALAHYNLGHAYSQAGRFGEAISAYETALQLAPDYAEAHNNLGNALAHFKRMSEAIVHYEAAVKLSSTYADAQANLASALVQSGQPAAAIPHFEAALRLRPASAELHAALGEAQNNWAHQLLQSGRTTEAIAHYETALQLKPGSAEIRYNLGNALLELNRPAQALTHYEAASQLAPDFAAAHHNLALTLVQLGRAEEALPHYREALRLAPQSALAYHNYALALDQTGRIAEAIREEETALRLQPDFDEARAHLESLQTGLRR